MLFGAGLVRTVEDFGTQGELPSHPELLDWLAVEFMKSEGIQNASAAKLPTSDFRLPTSWNLKALLKTIVMSATYRQTSKASPQRLQRDPENRLLGRAPRLRLPAEMIRD